jgi:hypothetical protein
VPFLLHKAQQHDDDTAMIGAIRQGMVPKHHDTPSPMIFAGLRIFNDNFTGGVYEHGTNGLHKFTTRRRRKAESANSTADLEPVCAYDIVIGGHGAGAACND